MDDQVKRLVDKAWARLQSTPADRRLRKSPGPRARRQADGRQSSASPASRAPVRRPRRRAAAPAADPPRQDDAVARRRAAAQRPRGGGVPRGPRARGRRAHGRLPPDARRGAAFTFDAPRFLALVGALRAPPGAAPVLAPSFDHALKDPRDGDIAVLPTHRVVVLEGNYLALDRDVWRDAAALLDELWFVDVDLDVARRRLRERHVRAGIARDLDEGDRRARENDLVNGEEILAHRLPVDEVVQSREDGSWVHE